MTRRMKSTKIIYRRKKN
uniref:Uncharacterized protein n=1 Tax=Romanomermis culicivorax TaxID=13658 RepID=A0A915J786_ROMCU